VLYIAVMYVVVMLLRRLLEKGTASARWRDDAAWYVAAVTFMASVWVCTVSVLQVVLLVLCGGNTTVLVGSLIAAQVMCAVLRGAVAAQELSV
jgi:hypothetical protein